MIADILMTLVSLGMILLSCVVFTNAIEWLGHKVHLGQGVVGSIFAAVGTALPETVIPIIAILSNKDGKALEVGIGSIAGAPFMLGTLAFFITGLAVVIYRLMGRRKLAMNADPRVVTRDLSYFIMIYAIAVFASFLQIYLLKVVVSVILVFLYIVYLKKTFSQECEQCGDLDPLFTSRFLKAKATLPWIIAQALLGLAVIILGADLFVKYVQHLSGHLGVSTLVLSIIITPIATELPEKLNSVIWTGKKKDTLALGNITGAMVFQSSVPVVFGILFTPWHLAGVTLVTAILALSGALFYLIWIKVTKKVHPFPLLVGGILYAIFLIYVASNGA